MKINKFDTSDGKMVGIEGLELVVSEREYNFLMDKVRETKRMYESYVRFGKSKYQIDDYDSDYDSDFGYSMADAIQFEIQSIIENYVNRELGKE